MEDRITRLVEIHRRTLEETEERCAEKIQRLQSEWQQRYERDVMAVRTRLSVNLSKPS